MLLNLRRLHPSTPARSIALAVALAVPALSVDAQALKSASLGVPSLVVQAEAVVSDKVALLHELALIESDTRLSMLFAMESIADPTGSHATGPAEKVWPAAKDALLAAGVEDFGPQLQALATAADASGIQAAGTEVLIAVAKARSALGANESELSASIHELTLSAAALISPEGVTPVAQYQDAWSLLGVARSEADLLLKAKDPAVAKAAVKVVMALDDIILFMPDPAASGPVTFDPATITGAATQIGTLFEVEA